MRSRGAPKILRRRERARPVPAVRREMRSAAPEVDGGRPPLLFVPGFGAGAWVFEEHWLDHAAGRGFAAYAMSVRGHGDSGAVPRATVRAYVHDVVQVAAGLPRRAVLIGHGAGALVVARALARYPARAAVLAAPVFGGPAMVARALVRNPFGTVPAVAGGRLRLPRRHLFSRDLPVVTARGHQRRMGRAGTLAQWQLAAGRAPEPAVGDPPVLVLGSPHDPVAPGAALERVARRYGAAPLLFPGMGHALTLDARWQEPLDALLDWLEKQAP